MTGRIHFGAATDAYVAIGGLAVDQAGTLFIASNFFGCCPSGGRRLRQVKNGIITTYLDTFAGVSLAFLPSGEFYFYDGQLKKMSAALPNLSWTEAAIASDDGAQLYIMSPSGRHLRTVDTHTNATTQTLQYDASGRLLAIADGNGNVTQVERVGAALAIVGPDGQRTNLSLDSAGFLQKLELPDGQSYQMNHQADGLLTSLIDPRGGSHTFTFDEKGRLKTDTDPAGGTQTLLRSAAAPAPEAARGEQVTHLSPLERSTQYLSETLQSGDTRRTTINPDGTTLMTLRDAQGSETTTHSDGTIVRTRSAADPRWGSQAPYAAETSVTTPAGLSSLTQTSRSVTLADPKDRLSLVKLYESSTTNGKTTTVTYDAPTRTVTTHSPMGRTSAMTIDDQGHVTSSSIPGVEPRGFTYDLRGRLTAVVQGSGGQLRRTQLSYGSDGFLATATDGLGRMTSYMHDADGRVTLQVEPDLSEVALAYDASGDLASVTPPGRPAHALNYTPVDLLGSYEPPPPDPGQSGNFATAYGYDLDRSVTKVDRPDGLRITHDHDAAGRLIGLHYPSALDPQVPEGAALAYDSAGRPSTVSSGSGVLLSYGYDGSLVTNEAWSGPITGSVGRTYDNNFRVATELVNNSDSLSFGYDADGLLTQAGALALARDSQNGLLAGTSLGQVADTWSYNSFAEPLSYVASTGAGEVIRTDFTRDKLGRITQKAETIGGTTTVYGYSYDLAGRLAAVTQNGLEVSRYAYDPNGNRTSKTLRGGVPTTATFDDQDRLRTDGPTTFTYTANGELLTKAAPEGVTHYAYDVLGNLRQVILPDGTQIDYLVDGRNRRVGKKVNGTLVQAFLYGSQLAPVAELDGSGNVVNRFVYGTKINVPEYMIRGGETYRIITDHLGSPRLVVNASTGAIAQRMDYDEWGVVLSDTAPGFQPFGFAGGSYDQATGLVRFGARDYEAQSGRWTARDPILFASHTTALFGYVDDDPTSDGDPSGLRAAKFQITLPLQPTWTPPSPSETRRFAPGYCEIRPPGVPYSELSDLAYRQALSEQQFDGFNALFEAIGAMDSGHSISLPSPNRNGTYSGTFRRKVSFP